VQINHLAAGRLPEGATVERAVPSPLGQGGVLQLDLNANDFNTAARWPVRSMKPRARAARRRWTAVSSGPAASDQNDMVAFIADIENLPITLAKPARGWCSMHAPARW